MIKKTNNEGWSGKMKKEQHKRKNSKKEKTKQSYSLRELVPKITGVKKDDYNFDAEYKAVQRIVQVMRNITGNIESNKRIPQDEKDSFVIITRNLYNLVKNEQSGQGQELFARMAAGETLTAKEYELLIKLFKEGFEANPELPLHKLLLERVNSENRFYQLQDEIEQLVQQDINLLIDLELFSIREQRATEYLSLLRDSSHMNTWRANVHTDLRGEIFKKKMIAIANEKGLDVQKVLEGKDHNLLEEVISEMIRRDVDTYLKNTDGTDS